MKPVVITIGGAALEHWTDMTLKRAKKEMTGSLDVTIFAGAMAAMPMITAAKAGAEIQVYIAGQLAFTGTVDGRMGTGAKKGKSKTGGTDDANEETKGESSAGFNVGPNEYTIKINARGKTKRLVDSSHQHPTTNMMQPTTKEVTEKLIEPFKVQLEWRAKVIKLDKQRFRDGARVGDELDRVSIENAYMMYETRDGKLRVTDGVGSTSGSGGDPLILGQNILEFSVEQNEEGAKSEVKVKGQRTKKDKWGKKAIEPTHHKHKNSGVKTPAYITVQHYGDATKEALERRGRFEANRRNQDAKKVTVEVFHVQTPSGQPWDIGNVHYVEIPCEGVFDQFECIELTYTVNAKDTVKTSLVLSPPPSGGSEGAAGGTGLGSINMNMGNARRSQAGIIMSAGTYPDPWNPPQLAEMAFLTVAEEAALAATKKDEEEPPARPPPLVLPPWFEEGK